MLIRFAVENYNSFKNQQIFSMVAGKQTRHQTHYYSINGKRLLKGSFFFGANASGKSNFVRALDFVRKMVLYGSNSINHTSFCACSKAIDICFSANASKYRLIPSRI